MLLWIKIWSKKKGDDCVMEPAVGILSALITESHVCRPAWDDAEWLCLGISYTRRRDAFKPEQCQAGCRSVEKTAKRQARYFLLTDDLLHNPVIGVAALLVNKSLSTGCY